MKIIDPLKELDEEETVEEKKEKHDNIEKKIVNVNVLNIEDEKKINQSIRIRESVLNALKVYCKVNDVPINTVIEEYLISKFKDKRIIRDRYEAEEEIRLLIPNDIRLLHEYLEKEINLIVNTTTSMDGNINLNQFDKQNNLYQKHPDKFKIIPIHTINNYLDEYDTVQECYYSKMFLNEVDVPNYVEFDKYILDYGNHVGIIALTDYQINEEPILHSSYEVVDVDKDKITVMNSKRKYITVFVLLHEYNNKLQKAILISPRNVLKLAKKVNNTEIIDYIENNITVASMIDIEREYDQITELLKQNTLLQEINIKKTEEIESLEEELNDLKLKFEEFNNHVKEEEEDNLKTNNITNSKNIQVKLDPKTADKLKQEIEENNNLLKDHIKFIQTNIKSNESKLKQLSEYEKTTENK